MESILRYTAVPDWTSLIIFLGLLAVAVAKAVQSTRFNEFVQLVFTNKYFLVHGKDNKIFSGFNLLLFINQILTVSIFIFLGLIHFSKSVTINHYIVFIQIFGFYSLFVGMKYYLEKIIAHLFSIEKQIDNYLYEKLSYRNLISLLLLAVNLVLLYALKPTTSLFIIVGTVIIGSNILALLYSYKTYEKQIRSNIFYFILYLCALEISPYYILYKILV